MTHCEHLLALMLHYYTCSIYVKSLQCYLLVGSPPRRCQTSEIQGPTVTFCVSWQGQTFSLLPTFNNCHVLRGRSIPGCLDLLFSASAMVHGTMAVLPSNKTCQTYVQILVWITTILGTMDGRTVASSSV